jgi:hypothetical protein
MFYMYGKKSETIEGTKNFRHDCPHSALSATIRTTHRKIGFSRWVLMGPKSGLGHDQNNKLGGGCKGAEEQPMFRLGPAT